MATGDQNDITSRLQQLTPHGWFANGATPIRDAVLQGIASMLAFVYSILAYVRLQTRIGTATDGFLDMIAADFFGDTLLRRTGQSDTSFRKRIIVNLFRERATRAGVSKVLTDLTGVPPTIFEPARVVDCGALGYTLGLGIAGRVGSFLLPFQAFVTCYRPLSINAPFLPGLALSQFGLAVSAGIGAGAAFSTDAIADSDVYSAVAAAAPVGTVLWTRIKTGTGADQAAQIAGGVAGALATSFPTVAQPVVAIKTADDGWIIRTPVAGGGAADYSEFQMYDDGGYLGIAHAWAIHSIRASIGGVINGFLEQDQSNYGNVSTVEFAMTVGLMTDPFDGAHFDFYGFGHGNMAYSGCSIAMGGSASNLRDGVAPGTVYRGSQLVFDSVYTPRIKNGMAIGSLDVAHIFNISGLTVSHRHNITAVGIGNQNSYSAMLPTTGTDRIKALGSAPIVIGLANGAQVGNWGPVSLFAFYNSAAPNNLLELTLPYGHPGSPPGDWSAATTSATFLLDNANGQRKLYVNWRSGTTAVPVSGLSNHLTRYSIRVGTPL